MTVHKPFEGMKEHKALNYTGFHCVCHCDDWINLSGCGNWIKLTVVYG